MTIYDNIYKQWEYITRDFEEVRPAVVRASIDNLEDIVREGYKVDYVDTQDAVREITGLNISGTSCEYAIHDLTKHAMDKASERYWDYLGE